MSTIYQRGIEAQQVGDLEGAAEFFRQAAAESDTQRPQAMERLVELSMAMGDSHDALRWLKKLLGHYRERGNHRGECRVSMQVAAILRKRDELDGALAWAQKALELAESQWSRQQMAAACQLKASLLSAMEKEGDAVPLLRRAQDIWEEQKDREGYYQATLQLGQTLFRLKDWSNAAKEFLTCVKILPSDSVEAAASLHLRLAAISLVSGWLREGVAHSLAALGRYRKLDSPRQKQALRGLASFLHELGEEEFWEQVAEHLDEESLPKVRELIENHLEEEEDPEEGQETVLEELGNEREPFIVEYDDSDPKLELPKEDDWSVTESRWQEIGRSSPEVPTIKGMLLLAAASFAAVLAAALLLQALF
jgi:tetratricopeptide (TPR) repeat protein